MPRSTVTCISCIWITGSPRPSASPRGAKCASRQASRPSHLEGEWDGLRWPLQGAAEYRSARGRYTLNGVPANYRYTLAGDFEGAEIPPLAVEAQGSGTADGLVFERLAVAALDGRLAATGTLDWKAGLAIDLGIDASGVNPGLRWPDWPGKLGLKTRLLVEVRDDAYRVQLQDARLEGTLRERPVSALGDVTFRAGGVESDRLVIRSGENSLTLSGRLAGSNWTSISASMPRTSRCSRPVWPGASRARVRCTATRRSPAGASSGRGRGCVTRTMPSARLRDRPSSTNRSRGGRRPSSRRRICASAGRPPRA